MGSQFQSLVCHVGKSLQKESVGSGDIAEAENDEGLCSVHILPFIWSVISAQKKVPNTIAGLLTVMITIKVIPRGIGEGCLCSDATFHQVDN